MLAEVLGPDLLVVLLILIAIPAAIIVPIVLIARRGTRSGQAPAAPSWFPDPSRRHELRFWDGRRWTEHVSDKGTASVDPP